MRYLHEVSTLVAESWALQRHLYGKRCCFGLPKRSGHSRGEKWFMRWKASQVLIAMKKQTRALVITQSFLILSKWYVSLFQHLLTVINIWDLLNTINIWDLVIDYLRLCLYVLVKGEKWPTWQLYIWGVRKARWMFSGSSRSPQLKLQYCPSWTTCPMSACQTPTGFRACISSFYKKFAFKMTSDPACMHNTALKIWTKHISHGRSRRSPWSFKGSYWRVYLQDLNSGNLQQ